MSFRDIGFSWIWARARVYIHLKYVTINVIDLRITLYWFQHLFIISRSLYYIALKTYTVENIIICLSFVNYKFTISIQFFLVSYNANVISEDVFWNIKISIIGQEINEAPSIQMHMVWWSTRRVGTSKSDFDPVHKKKTRQAIIFVMQNQILVITTSIMILWIIMMIIN